MKKEEKLNKSISEKQLKANRENAKKGGVKTTEGKEIVKYNALKHGILSKVITDLDKWNIQDLLDRLIEELIPSSTIEEILIERIALCIIRLNRVAYAETEYIKNVLNPFEGHYEDNSILDLGKWVVDKVGYSPKIRKGDIEPLGNIYHRYEKSLENRLYRALHELERIQRARKGEKIPPPISVDIGRELD